MGKVIWFTGLSGSGKTTLSIELRNKLERSGKTVEILDGDVIREKLHKTLGFSREDIKENNQLIAKIVNENKERFDFVLVPIISPYREDRAIAKSIIGKKNFIELYLDVSLNECIRRDVKGLYKKALAGEINNFIGIAESNPYEIPQKPDLKIDTTNQSIENSANKVLFYIVSNKLMNLKYDEALNLPFEVNYPEIYLSIVSALKAGEKVMAIYNTDFNVDFKDGNEPLTEADLASDTIIKEIINLSGHPVLSEEGDETGDRLNNEYSWIIDPLDGTSDFISKTNEFTIMISLVRKNRPILGVIYHPVGDTLYLAQDGTGAFKLKDNQWSRMNVNNKFDLTTCQAVGSRHHLSEQEKEIITQLGIFDFKQRGSSLKSMDVSSGKAEIYFTTTNKIKQWDTCASYCIVKEAGGKMTDMFGNELKYNTEFVHHENGILVTNGRIHDLIVEKYKEFT
tara:strand:- start:622 stop:1983 length:1362 start_codon:yes stop_codon:yes gene_type:complete